MRRSRPVQRGIGPASFAVMRRFVGLLCGTALGFCASVAGAQQVVTPAPPGAPVTADPVKEPPYDPAQHFGLTEAAWLRATRGTVRRSTSMMATGLTLGAAGASLMLAGTLLYVSGNNKPCGGTGESTLVLPCSSTTDHVTGMALLTSGLIGLGLGLPLTFYGAADVPRIEAGGVTGPQIPRVTVALGLRGAAFALHF
jgi:hypothetical protein